jgi:type IV pilus assembly protein PilX
MPIGMDVTNKSLRSEKEKEVMGRKSNFILRNESGVALVVALLMIVILSLIGLASSSTSTFEIRLSGNKRGATDAFYTAEAGAQSVMANTGNFSTAYYAGVPDPNTLAVDLRNEWIDAKLTTPSLSLPSGVSYPEAPQVTIYHTTRSTPPKASGFSAIHFEFQNYIIDSIGRDQLDAGANRPNCEIREKVVRLVPTMQGGY